MKDRTPDMNTPCSEKLTRPQAVPEPMKLTLNERLGLISLIDEETRSGAGESPLVADLFSQLWNLVDKTVSGSKIDRLKPERSSNGFRVFEINGETGENLARLNLLYLRKPIPCYYLVYVEVAPPFRNKGLGSRILHEFRELMIRKSAVGILDNIIPEEDPTFTIYSKLDWKSAEESTGSTASDEHSKYMIFIPPALVGKDLREPIRKLLYHIMKKRPAIEMRDNEAMVGRTIEEFKELYGALLTYFGKGLESNEITPLMRFMFTRFVTKLLGFRRRISELLGYTGGESLEQIVLDDAVRRLPVLSYAPRDLANNTMLVSGDKELWLLLPEEFKKHPARMIESLPNYRRPSLLSWIEAKGTDPTASLTIGDLMELGFDPTRLKELELEGERYIFERLHPRLLDGQVKKKDLLEGLASSLAGERVRKTPVKTNPPLLIIRDRGNCYVLRRKVAGIHWEEAVEQLHSQPALKALNSSLGVDRMILATVRKAKELLESRLAGADASTVKLFTFFVAWDLENNRPNIAVDMSGSAVESLWLA